MSVSGRYNGHRFRSLLELSFMVQKVEREGFVLGESLLYEHERIPYKVGKRTRTYVVDFWAPVQRVAWELTWSTRRGTANKVRKARVAVEHFRKIGANYLVVTEKDVPRITLRQAALMKSVVLDPSSRRRLGRSWRRKRILK